MNIEKEYVASLETGGTKCVCAIGTAPDDITHIQVFETTTPNETLPAIIAYFKPLIAQYNIKKMGITSFGPIDIHKNSPTYGYITSTPKTGWKHTDLVGTMREALHVEIVFDTDVNGAALAEGKWGAAKGLSSFVYITVGTGIGVGIVSDGKSMKGMLHPEGGHMLLPLHPDDITEGFCPYHKGCFEGLAAGPSFQKRWGMPAVDIPDDHIAWDIEAYYLAVGIVNLVCVVSPQRVILGGGISKRESIFPKVRTKVQALLADYIQCPEITLHIDEYIVAPVLEHSGLLGGIIMATNIE